MQNNEVSLFFLKKDRLFFFLIKKNIKKINSKFGIKNEIFYFFTPSFSKLFSSLVDNFLKRRTTVLVDLFSKFLNDCILILQVIKTAVDQFNDLLLELSADAFFLSKHEMNCFFLYKLKKGNFFFHFFVKKWIKTRNFFLLVILFGLFLLKKR